MFWDIFYKTCNSKNTSPNAVAKEIGVSSATCTHWKNGAIPNGETLLKLADYLSVSVDYLLGRTDSPNNAESNNTIKSGNINGNNNVQSIGAGEQLSKRDSELLKKINSLSLDDYADIISYINSKTKAV